MSNDLVEAVKFCFTDQVMGQLSSLVDESESGVEQALSKAVPLVLSGLLRQVEEGTAPETLLHLVRDADEAAVLAHLSPTPDFAWNERGTDLLLDLLGDTYRTTVNQIAAEARIQPAASGTLLQAAATAVLGVLGKFAVENDLTPPEFVHWLQSQKEAIGASLLPVPGLGPPLVNKQMAAASRAAASRQPAPTPPRRAMAPARLPYSETGLAPAAPSAARSTGGRWQWGGLLLLAVSLGYFFGRTSPPAAQSVAAPAPVVVRQVSAPAPVALAPAVASPPTASAPAAAPPVAAPVAAPVAKTPKAADPPATSAPAAPEARPRSERRASAPRADSFAGTGSYDPTRDVYIHDTGRPTVLTLANGGGTENVGAASTEARLYGALTAFNARTDSVSRNSSWIDFDRLYFEPGQSTLTPESMLQLTNIARILKTFPDVVVKIGGYTDSTGLGPQDQRISEARARAVMTALSNQGVRLYRLFAQGYGSKYSVAPNTTPASRALNRRVSIRVLRKQS